MIAISEILVLVGTFFGPHEENSFFLLFKNTKMQKVFCDGCVGIEYTVCTL